MNDKTEDQWRDELTSEQYAVLRQSGTERPYSGTLLDNKETGEYLCAGCGNKIFDSNTKFDSNSGWPSFTDAIERSVELHEDNSHGMSRTEVKCAKCSSHLGHVFNDGPEGKDRYCINSVCLDFKKEDQ